MTFSSDICMHTECVNIKKEKKKELMRDIGHLSLTLMRSLFTYVLTVSMDPYKYPDGYRITTPERRLSSSRDFCVCWDVDLHPSLFSPQT